MSTRVLGLASTLILVRLLAPADFGLVALATGFWQAVDALSSFGIEEAIIREKTPTRDLYDTGFTLNALRGLTMVALIAVSAYPLSRFFEEPRLAPVMFALAVAALANGLENIGIVDFRRDLNFRREFVLNIVPRLAASALTIAIAFTLRDYRALIAGILAAALLRLAAGYVLHPYRPSLSLAAWHRIAGFSTWSWALSVACLARDRLDNAVIGRMLGLGPAGLAPVGVYSVGVEIAGLPITELVSPLGRACFSAFAALRQTADHQTADRHTTDDLNATFLRLIGSASLICLPAGVGISLIADPIVTLAFGPAWQDAIPLIQLLGIALTATVLGTISTAMLTAFASLRPQFTTVAAATVFRFAAVVALIPTQGLLGAAIGMSLATVAENLALTTLALRRLGIAASALLHHIWRSIAATTAMAAALIWLGLGWTKVPPEFCAPTIALAIPVAALLYTAATTAIWLATGRPKGAERDALTMLTTLRRKTIPKA